MSGADGLSAEELDDLRHVALIAHSNGHDGMALDVTQDRVIAVVERIIASRTDTLTAERDELREQVARVEAIHYRVVPEHVAGPGWCHSCPTEWPCPTIAALHPADGAA